MEELSRQKRREVIERGLDTKNAAAYIGLTPKTLHNYRSLETGPCYYTSAKGPIYDPEDLDDYLEKTMKRITTSYYAKEILMESRCKGDLGVVSVDVGRN